MKYQRMAIEMESPEESGYGTIKNNLSESSVADQSLQSLGLRLPPGLTLQYNEHRGSNGLRQLIAEDAGVSQADVIVTSGAAGALFIISTSQLAAGDHLVVIRPNYATNLETPRAIGCDISFLDLSFESKWQPDLDALEAAIKPNTKLVSITCPHNPTGSVLPREALDRLVAITKARGVLLLVDETYRDITYGPKLPVAASLGDHIVSVSSLSKSFGLPGIRIGWAITRNEVLQETFLAAKEQISISGSVIDEWIAEQVLARRQDILAGTMQEMKIRLQMVEDWVNKEELIEWAKPAGGTVCFLRMKKEPAGGLEAFYKTLATKYGTYMALGHWFEMPDTYFRLGYGWPTRGELQAGMETISQAMREIGASI